MSDAANFVDLIRRVRARDEQAAAELLRRYEQAIRVAVRVRLASPDLRRVLDTMDIVNSVLGNFFRRVAVGEFELTDPRRLLAMLAKMAQNKIGRAHV